MSKFERLVCFFAFFATFIGGGMSFSQTLEEVERRFVNTSLSEALLQPEVENELELVEDQLVRLREIYSRPKGPGAEIFSEDEISEILLEHQTLRLRQIRVQISLRMGSDAAFAIPTLLGGFDLPLDKIQKVAAKCKKSKADLLLQVEKRMAASRIDVFQRFSMRLKPSQQKVKDELYGRLVVPPHFTSSLAPLCCSGNIGFENALSICRPWLLKKSAQLVEVDPFIDSRPNLMSIVGKAWVQEELKLTVHQAVGVRLAIEMVKGRGPLSLTDASGKLSRFEPLDIEELPISNEQKRRLQQICLQSACGAFRSPDFGLMRVRNALQLSAEQLAELGELSRELDEKFVVELKKELEKLRKQRQEHFDKIVATLTKDQKDSYLAVTGELFVGLPLR